MHNDEPTLQDDLDRRALTEEVGKAVATCTPPQVFGVHGDWGLGKTSFLHQVQWYLTGACPQLTDAATEDATGRGPYKNVHAIWFDAWRYQYEEAPVIALLQEIRAQLSYLAQGRRRKVIGVAIRGALLSIEEVTKKVGFQYSKFQQANREWNVEHFADPLPSYTIRLHLREAIDQLLPKKARSADLPSPRLVIFIDDIDRCEPEAAFRLLEGLKIYLTLENCVFVLGMNQKVIEEAIGNQMPNKDAQKERAAAYMEKLCQNVWRLPAIRDPHEFFRSLLKETVSAEVAQMVIDGVKDHNCLPPNPRRLKGLANLVGRLSIHLPTPAEGAEAVRETQILMVVAYIYQFHHDLYVRWEADLSLYDKIYDWSVNNQGHDLFESMILPQREADADPSTPTPRRDYEGTYPDPADARVFWMQPLIRHLGSEVHADQFRPYLYREDRA